MDALTVILIFYASVLCSFCNRGRKSKKGRYEYESSSQEFDRNSFAEPSISSNESYIDRFNREVTAIHQHSYEEQGTGSITEAIGEMEHGGERGIYDFTYLSHSSSRASSKDDVYDQGDNFSQKSSSVGNDDQGYRIDQASNWSGPSGSQGSHSGLAGSGGGYSS